MFGKLTNFWSPNSSASSDSPPSHPNKFMTTDNTMDPNGSKDVLMISETPLAPEECPESPPGASDAQFMSKHIFELYKQKQARVYSRLNEKNIRLHKLDQANREDIKRLVKELASKTDEVQEAQMNLLDARAELNACKEEQKKLEGDRLREKTEMVAFRRELREWRETVAHSYTIQKDLEIEQEAHKATKRELQSYKANQDHTQADDIELQSLRQKLAASQRELSACKDDLFRLQPIAQTPDSDISKNFDFICQQIVNWIDGELLEFEHANPNLSQKDFFLVGGDNRVARHHRRTNELGEYLSRSMIHCYLLAKLLGPSCSPLGLTEGAQEWLQRTKRSMAKLDPPRDPATISAWRSETLKAITRTEESQKLQEQQIQAMTMDMFESLSETFPVVFGNLESMNRFYEQVMQPALKLAITLQGACSTYCFDIAESPFTKFKPLTTDQIKDHCMIDIKTRMTLKPNAGVVADENGVFGRCIMMLEPGLYRINKGKEDSTLRQRVYLVELDHPIRKRKVTVSCASPGTVSI